MSIYVDVETSAEALQEDEELIEAVEALVENAAVSVYTEVRQDVHDVITYVKGWLEYFMPVLIVYQQDHARMYQDMERLMFYLCLLAVTFFTLTPFSAKSQRKKSWLSLHWILENIFSILWAPFSFLSSFRDSPNQYHDQSLLRHKKSAMSSKSGSNYYNDSNNSTDTLSASDEETDEERFEFLYPSISLSRYRKLVLPPTCKLVAKHKNPKRMSVIQQPGNKEDKNENQKENANEKKQSKDNKETKQNKKEKKAADKKKQNEQDESDDDEDNPAKRLQVYFQHFLHLIRSLFTYDYAAAGWTILLWMQGIRRYRKTASDSHLADTNNNNQNGINNDDEDSVASQKSTANSVTSYMSNQSSKASTRHLSSLFGTPKKNSNDRSNIEITLPNRLSMVSDGGKKETRRADSFASIEEEKKDLTTNEFAMPKLPIHRTSRELSDSSFFNSTMVEVADDGDTDVVTSNALASRRPLPTSNNKRASSIGKSKDALEHYRLTRDRPSTIPKLQAAQSDGNINTSTAVARSAVSQIGDIPACTSGMTNDSDKENAFQQRMPSLAQANRSSASFFFESANSRASISRYTIDVGIPDKNGYILGDEYLPSSNYTPLLVFVNTRSGPRQGHLLIAQLRRLLNPIQVYDLGKGPPEPVLESFCAFTRLRILVCGGDGTVAWIVSAMERLELKRKWPPIAILPLGTGNDLARIHGWGGGYSSDSLITILEQISESYISLLDRWRVTIDDTKHKKKEEKTFFNYLGVGADAQAALQVHYLRESKPEWFFSRLVNKLWYGIFGAEDIIKASSFHIYKEIKLYADGVQVALPEDSQGIIILNIDSYAGGVPLWSHGVKSPTPNLPPAHERIRRSQSLGHIQRNPAMKAELERCAMSRNDSMDDLQMATDVDMRACELPSSCQDGILEVVSIRGAFHLGQIRVGLSNAQRLCQCREVTIKIKRRIAVQVDGEPWRQSPCTLRVKRMKDPAVMLHRSSDDGGVETEMSKLLDWAEERKIIDNKVHTTLMKEFSRRIENKTRMRRFRSQDNAIFQNLKRAIVSSGAMSNPPGSQLWQSESSL